MNFERSQGNVKFLMGSMDDLPIDAEEIKLFMRSGDLAIYIVPVSEIPAMYTKIEMETNIGKLYKG